MKLIWRKQNAGSKLVIQLNGSKRDIEAKMLSIKNWSGFKGDLEWHHEREAHFWIGREELLVALAGPIFIRMMNEDDERQSPIYSGQEGEQRAEAESRQQAETFLNLVEKARITRTVYGIVPDTYKVGYLELANA